MLINMIFSYMTTQCLYTVVKLGIADYLVNGGKSINELAKLADCHADPLYRVMRCLASQGIFIEKSDKTFHLNDLSKSLINDSTTSMASFINICAEELYQASAGLLDTVKQGVPAFDRLYKKDFWSYLQDNPDRAEIFNTAMEKGFNNSISEILSAYDFSHYKTFVDVGGGKGQLTCAILSNNKHAQGIIYDLAYVEKSAKGYISYNSLDERCRFVSGDFFQQIPIGGDVYLLRVILHDWNDEKSQLILKNCHKAMQQHSKLILIEKVIVNNGFETPTCLGDVNMLVSLTGKERTISEYEELLNQSNFRLNAVRTTKTAFSILEAIPIFD